MNFVPVIPGTYPIILEYFSMPFTGLFMAQPSDIRRHTTNMR